MAAASDPVNCLNIKNLGNHQIAQYPQFALLPVHRSKENPRILSSQILFVSKSVSKVTSSHGVSFGKYFNIFLGLLLDYIFYRVLLKSLPPFFSTIYILSDGIHCIGTY